MNSETHISNIQAGNDNTIYSIGTANNIYINVNGTTVDAKYIFGDISVVLSNYRNFFGGHVHIDRNVTQSLLNFCTETIEDKERKIAVVLGSAGMGKSVVMHDLLDKLMKNDHIGVLAIKADRVVNSEGIAKNIISNATPLIDLIRQYASTVERFVLLVDQIDALSQSMSNDRRAINYQDNLIQQVKQIPNSKIVVSCRPYDMQYDPILESYSKYKKFELSKLSETEVMKVLNDTNIKHTNIGPHMMLFLQVPLHLYLYCLLNDGTNFKEDITLQKMYDKIWSEYIIKRSSGHELDSNKIIEFLRTLSDEMFDKQSLFVNFRKYENEYHSEINYLSTNGIINIDDEIIQFFHQSFFDYVYARMFIESGKSLTSELNKAHQGLFIRQRVKQILTYEREVDEVAYAGHLKDIFYSNGNNYRYHIKMLVLTTIGYYNEILPCENMFINDYIIKDKQLAKVFVESVYSRSWFQYFIHTNYANDAIRNVDLDKIKLIIELCERLEYQEPDVVLGYIDEVLCAVPDNTVKINIARLIDRSDLKDFADLTKSIYYKINDPNNGISMPNYLRIMIDMDVGFVVNELINDIERAIKKIKPNDFTSRLNVDYKLYEVYVQVSKNNNDAWFDFLFAALNLFLKYEDNSKLHHGILRYSFTFLMYNRKEPYLEYLHYFLADSMFDLVEKQSVEDPDWLIPRLKQMNNTHFALFQRFIMAAYAKNVDRFKSEIYLILTNKELLEDFYPSSTTYSATILLKKAFRVFDNDEKRHILDVIMSLRPEMEKIPLVNLHKCGYSLTDIGITTGYYLYALGSDVLQNYPKEEKEFNKLLEKYKNLDCTPSKMQSQEGWITIPKENREKMSDEDIMKSLVSYPTYPDIGKRDAIGTNIAFGQDAAENPKRFASIIDRILNDEQYSFSSITEGIKGLMQAKYDNKVIDALFSRAITRIGDINGDRMHDGDIMSMLRLTDYYIKSQNMPQFVIDFICYVLNSHNYDGADESNLSLDLYNTGINRVNGSAGAKLVECCMHDKYKEKIFSTLEGVANSASAVTRSAILLEMRTLSSLDEDRTRNLYLLLMHDCDERLLAMPLHNNNPLLCFVGKHFSEVIPLMEKALELPKCFNSIVFFLWLAFYYGNKEAHDLVLQMTESSADAQASLIQYIIRERNENTKNAVDEFLYLLLKSENKNVGSKYDVLFNNIDKWNENDMKNFVTAYSNSKVSQFAGNGVFSFIEKTASKFPRECLQWIINIYNNKKDIAKDVFGVSRIMNIITVAYNGIHKYDKDDKTLEAALDIFDQILQDDSIRNATRYFLNKLDSEEN